MKIKRGFTLLEVLIAAVIMSVLAMLSTAAYKHTVSETRVQDSKNKLQVVANAVQRYMWDFPNRTMTAPEEGKPLVFLSGSDVQNCPKTFSNSALIQCEYLENRAWSNDQIHIVACGGNKSGYLCSRSSVSNPLACMAGINARIDTRYLYDVSKGFYHVFCISATTEGWS